jgi:hypothetical protein
MKPNRKVFLVLLAFVLIACATTMDAKLTYLTARNSYNAALENYINRVSAMPAGAEKDQIKTDFNPVWKDGDAALDSWGDIVMGISTEDPTEATAKFLDAKNKLIELGLKYFGDRLFKS